MADDSIKPVAVLQVIDEHAANLKILGLTVQERNIRQLERAGFTVGADPSVGPKNVVSHVGPKDGVSHVDPNPQGKEIIGPTHGSAPTSEIFLRGDFQYPNRFFRDVGADPSVGPKNGASHVDTNPHGKQITGPTHGSAPTSGLDVSALLKNGETSTRAILEQSLFDEILANTGGVIARTINKKISFALTRLLVKTNWTPNGITFVNFLIGVIGCIMLLSLSWPMRALGAFFIQMNSVLDGCDGEVAVLKVQFSRLGAWLDTIADDVLNNLMFICLSLGYYRETHNVPVLRFCLATVFASLGVSFFLYHYLVTHNTQNAAHYKLSWDKSASLPSPLGERVAEGRERGAQSRKNWFDVVKIILKRDCFIFICFILVALDLRLVLTGLFVPMWGAFFLYLASFLYGWWERS